MRLYFAAALIMLGQPVFAETDLGTAVRQFSGRAAIIDGRQPIPDCSSQWSLDWQTPRSLKARCAVDGRQLAVMLAEDGPKASTLRRGQVVQATATGAGFSLQVEAIADSNARQDDRLVLKNSRSQKRFSGIMDHDGRIFIPSDADMH